MSTITLPNIRVSSDLTIRLKLKDGGVAIDWSTLQNIRVSLYADDQRSMASRCNVSIDEEDSTILVCQYAANKMQYLGVNRVIVQCKYMGEIKTYDKPAFNFVRWTSDQEGEQITIDDPDVDVEISVEDVSSSILQEAVDAAFDAADRANDAAAAAEHMVDIHTGPEGKSAYEVAVEEGYTGTEEEWLASLEGPVGATPDISIGTVTTVEPGTPAAASMTGTPEAPLLNLSIPKGLVGATPNFTVGTVTTGEPGSSVIVTITGTPEAPVLNLTIPQGMQGNTGSSVDYPYELVNNLTTNDATKGLSAAQGVVLDGKVSQLEAKSVGIETQSISDLDISDEYGNVLVRFKDGGVQTKEFDSSKVNLETEGQNNSDLDIADEFGNVLVRFKDGGIKTKNFDSKKFADAPVSGYENFLIQVNAGIEDNDSTSGNLQDSSDPQNDRSIINFPPNYDANGEPVRLVIANFGSAGRIQSSTTKAYYTMPLVDTILAEGYAIMQVNGTPGETDGIANYGGMGTPAFLQCVQAAYKYVTEKYNIKRDGVLLSGWSQGTLKSWQIATNKILPVRAMALFAPVTDLWKLQYAYAPQATREWMCEQFGFVEKEANKYVLDIFGDIYEPGDIVTKPTTYSAEKTLPTDEEFAYILNNFETWLGYDPICWGTSKDIIGEQFRYRSWVTVDNPNENLCFLETCNIVPCPVKLFVGTADIYTTPKIVNWYKMMADHGGQLCHLRVYQGGTHNFPSDYGTISVSTKYGGTITTNVPSWEGMLFLERYD